MAFRLASSLFLSSEWKFERENGAVTHAVALRHETSPEFLSGQRGTVQAEAVPIRFGGESVGKDAGNIFASDAHAVVLDEILHRIASVQPDADRRTHTRPLRAALGWR